MSKCLLEVVISRLIYSKVVTRTKHDNQGVKVNCVLLLPYSKITELERKAGKSCLLSLL